MKNTKAEKSPLRTGWDHKIGEEMIPPSEIPMEGSLEYEPIEKHSDKSRLMTRQEAYRRVRHALWDTANRLLLHFEALPEGQQKNAILRSIRDNFMDQFGSVYENFVLGTSTFQPKAWGDDKDPFGDWARKQNHYHPNPVLAKNIDEIVLGEG